MKHKHQKVGIDLGIKTFATLSDPNTFETPSSMKSENQAWIYTVEKHE